MNEPTTAPAEAHEPLRPLALTTERRTGPIGLDEAAPLFGWQLAATGRGRAQSAYRLRVEDAACDSVWDSGWQRSGRTADILYEGSALVPCTRYSWRVSVADEEGARSGWSEVGLLRDRARARPPRRHGGVRRGVDHHAGRGRVGAAARPGHGRRGARSVPHPGGGRAGRPGHRLPGPLRRQDRRRARGRPPAHLGSGYGRRDRQRCLRTARRAAFPGPRGRPGRTPRRRARPRGTGER